MMVKEIRHSGIAVSDLERSVSFYRDLLGFRVYKEMLESGPHMDAMLALKGVQVTTVKMSAPGGGAIELLKFHSHPEDRAARLNVHQVGITHLAFTVESIDEAFDKLTSKGIEFNSKPQNSPDGYARVAFCRDPDGNLLEMVEVLQK